MPGTHSKTHPANFEFYARKRNEFVAYFRQNKYNILSIILEEYANVRS